MSATAEYSRHADTAYQQGFRSINYGIINQWLRSNNVQDKIPEADAKSKDSLMRRLIAVVRNLDSRMKQSNRTMTVYRGIPHGLYEAAVETGIIVNKAFTSTSRNVQQAQNFGEVILKIRVPEHIGRYNFPNAKEEEVLLERNTLCDNFERVGTSPSGMPIISCELKKFTPPPPSHSDEFTKKKKEMMHIFIKQLEDEDIDWDAI